MPTTLAAPRCDQIISRVAEHHTGSARSCADQAIDVTLALYPAGATFDPAALPDELSDELASHPQVDTAGVRWRIHAPLHTVGVNTCPSCHLERTLSGDCPLGC